MSIGHYFHHLYTLHSLLCDSRLCHLVASIICDLRCRLLQYCKCIETCWLIANIEACNITRFAHAIEIHSIDTETIQLVIFELVFKNAKTSGELSVEYSCKLSPLPSFISNTYPTIGERGSVTAFH